MKRWWQQIRGAQGLRLSFVAALIAWSQLGCLSHTRIPEADQSALKSEHDGAEAYLKQSLYAGEFYDDDRFMLVHPSRFEELRLLRHPDGTPITPPPHETIIPAGTRVRIDAVDFPTGAAVLGRPLFTPRYAIWVWMRVAQYRGANVSEQRKRVAILPMHNGMAERATFDAWFDAYFSSEDNNPWLDGLAAEDREAIFEKRARLGMDYAMLTAALGYPDRLDRELAPDGAMVEVAVFGAQSVVLTDGEVTDISDPYAPVAGTDP